MINSYRLKRSVICLDFVNGTGQYFSNDKHGPTLQIGPPLFLIRRETTGDSFLHESTNKKTGIHK
ncbi:hypothetical protein HX13_04285 [Chryseobacterium sp. P1-3]|uniref:hypothetical protein n=1 Tax=Chryseobacterium sp. (strain P1-3) TaxID=1517683 RepID=UPI0004E74CA5|nr:hypothetical protein [Chryseobacterium sp. P1-3]KFF75410.1 hypothetical protein HX13_04285 [Chryseobacterium sp. P1-3]